MKHIFQSIPSAKALLCLFFLAILTFSCQSSTTDPQSTKNVTRLDMEDLMAPFAPKAQTFTVSGTKPSIVNGKAGTRIHVDPKNLSLPDGSAIKGEIAVKLIECTQKSEILGAGLQTVSNGKLLESGGSYFIDMQADGQQLTIKKGKSIDVEFTKITKEGMELFYGSKDALGQMNWAQTDAKFEDKPAVTSKPKPVGYNANIYSIEGELNPQTDTIYQYFTKSRDTFGSTNIDDIYAFMKAEESGKPIKQKKDLSNEESRLQRKALAAQKTSNSQDERNRKNQQAMADRRQVADYEEEKQKEIALAKTAEIERAGKARLGQTQMEDQEFGRYSALKLNRFGWINCDHFMNETNLKPVIVQFQQKGEAKPAFVYYVLEEDNSILSEYYDGTSPFVISKGIPVGKKVVVLAISKDAGSKYSFARSTITVGAIESISLELKSTPIAEIQIVFSGF